MTINEAIKHAEEVAEKQEELYRLCPASESEMSHCDGTKDCKTLESGKNKGCQKCAEEHRQLAEWLKDYKRLLEHQPSDDTISRHMVLDLVVANHMELNGLNVVMYSPLYKDIKQLPPVTSQPRHGKWIVHRGYNTDGFGIEYSCSKCNEWVDEKSRYCPNCGCRMVEPQEEEWVNFADDLMPIIDEIES